MFGYMSSDDYKELSRLRGILDDCLVSCAHEISMISKGRRLIGEWDGDDETYDDDRYLVSFETCVCYETDRDSVFVPIKFIYDKKFREYWRKILMDEKERDRQQAIYQEEQRKANTTTYRIVTDERAEYERLKEMFGGE